MSNMYAKLMLMNNSLTKCGEENNCMGCMLLKTHAQTFLENLEVMKGLQKSFPGIHKQALKELEEKGMIKKVPAEHPTLEPPRKGIVPTSMDQKNNKNNKKK